MENFNAAAEMAMLAKMSTAAEYMTARSSGQMASVRLMDAVNEHWCKLTPSEQNQTADLQKKSGLLDPNPEATILIDGKGLYAGIKNQNGGVIPFNCEKPSQSK